VKKYVIVKQSHSRNELIRESDWLEMLKTRDTVHVVRLLREYYEAVAGGADSRFDPDKGLLGSIFLEYCVNGDMTSFIRKLDSWVSPL
jgi:hypothetical protein